MTQQRPGILSIRSLPALLLAAALSATAPANLFAAQSAPATLDDARKDPVLRAMLEELDRSKQHLQLQNFEKPFFIQYRLDDVQDYDSSASYGASTGDHDDHRRIVRVTVRVGGYQTDSSPLQSGRGDGSLQIAALDNDPIALRYALWSATDTAYKAALHEFAQKQAALKQFQTPPGADDFVEEKPTVQLDDLQSLHLDRDAWNVHLAEVSALYRTDPQVKGFSADTQYSTASLHARVVNRYLVNTEGTVVRRAFTDYHIGVGVGTQAADGMRLDRSYLSSGSTAEELDSPEQLRTHVVGMLFSLRDLKQAPVVVEEYHGPVLFSNDAVNDLFYSTVSDAVAADRPEPGTDARTVGPYANSYKARVLPEQVNVVDDPTMKTFDGKSLLGAYDVDDEGVPAESVPVVESGRLTHYLLGRQPIRDFPQSNGHGRAAVAGAPTSHAAVMHVTSSSALPVDELNKKLLALAKDQGLDSAYYVETLGPELAPRLLYRVHLADGKRELVRGGQFDELDQRSLRSGISAVGSDPLVSNYPADIATTIIAPSVLFEEITVKRANAKNDKLPYYPPPQ